MSTDESSYWCTRSDASDVLGAYDGLESWTLHATALTDRDEQAIVSVHERLHHELQHSTPWGLVARFSADLARLGVLSEQLRLLFRFCRESARLVHETYATTLSVGNDPFALELLEQSPDYKVYFDQGTRLSAGTEWEAGRFQVDALLRAAMSPAALEPAYAGGFTRLRTRDLNGPDTRPDARLTTILSLDLPRFRPHGLGPGSTPDELGVFFDEVADFLTRNGVPTLRTAPVRELIDDLFEDIAALSPELRARIELDSVRAPIPDDIEEHQRERIRLHDTGPLPLEIVPESEIAARAADFARDHEQLGAHVLLVWARADLLARQFARPNALEERAGFVVALQAAGYDSEGRAVARLGLFDTESPADVARAFTLPVVCLTTAASLTDAPGSARSDHIDTIYAIADLPIVSQLVHTFKQKAHVNWMRADVDGDRKLHVFAFTVSVLPGIVWLQLTGEAGRHYLQRWLTSLGPEQAESRPEEFTALLPGIDAAVQHVVSAWWIIDQQGGRAHV
ncbi:hypothetical protein ACFXKC_18610 [Streptomyces sp. NPDC059340]|uniref:hypothetical protein n=1 Tax=Streptomyces sp. NPDC059340 TaxID=3346806 RepID=UPI0036C577FE